MRKRWAPRTHSPIHAMGCCHHPVSLDEGPSAGVMPVATGVVLEGDLGRGGRTRNTGGVSPYGPGGLRPPWNLPADPGKDPPGRARRAPVPRSHRLPVAPHRDPARSSVLWERGLGWRGKPRHQLTRLTISHERHTAEGEGGEEDELQHHPGPRQRFGCGGGCTAGGFKRDGGGGTGRKPGDLGLSSSLGPSSKTHTAPKARAEKPWVHPKSPSALHRQPKSARRR